jgi:hypothetical protein
LQKPETKINQTGLNLNGANIIFKPSNMKPKFNINPSQESSFRLQKDSPEFSSIKANGIGTYDAQKNSIQDSSQNYMYNYVGKN